MSNNAQGDEKRKTWRLLVVAGIFALLAGIGTMVYLKLLEHRLEKRLTPAEKQMVQVVVANRDLAVGSKVDSTTMAIRRVPAEYVNSDVVTPDQFDAVDGAVLNKVLAHGKMLSRDYIDLNIPRDFSGTIQVGHRAVTIQVGEINSVAGLVRPGNYIDLYTRLQGGAASTLDAADGGEVVIPVLEDVLVLATDQRSARPNEDEFVHLAAAGQRQTYDTLTLEVTPEEAALITIAESRGSLVATLRNTDDTGGVRFSKIGLGDLVAHAGELRRQALNKQEGRGLAGVHVDEKGRLVTQNGVAITDPGVHLNEAGLLVNGDGTVLSGRDLVVGEDGRLRTAAGRLVDTASLVAGKDGTLVDKNGTVVDGNGYTDLKDGFMVDKDGRVLTHNGEVLTGVTVGKDGKVRTPDGRVVEADDLVIDKDGRVYVKPDSAAGLRRGPDGTLVDADGKPVKAADLVTVGPDGVVRTRDGKVLQGVTLGADGTLMGADGKPLSAADVMLASRGFHAGADGTVVDADGEVYAARDLVTVDKDGTVRTQDGTVIEGAHVDADGVLRDKNGNLLTARDVIADAAIAKAAAQGRRPLAGVSGHVDPDFVASIGRAAAASLGGLAPEEVEYIVGGSSDGIATTFVIQVEEKSSIKKP